MQGLTPIVPEPVEQRRFEGKLRGRSCDRVRLERPFKKLEGGRERVDIERGLDERVKLRARLFDGVGRIAGQWRSFPCTDCAIVPHQREH